MKWFSLSLIRFYQTTGGSKRWFNTECNFEPSCSEYTRQCIVKYGAIKGWRLGVSRIRRCTHPDLVEKIYDEVP
ncbi:membrane protein insertion efficiency factor YidD [Vibrio porteresiae]|uniref:Membrane protein insertion efficiency factor YidD n=1 Tax=Vibrio porteresiae DSM 19223 TaxID=1123496 RepID=A0ABZ0QK78_9VIBR|nr:membrane protein insertion efficiency factor YidD [Vibrio porteresiae]WPC75826.1 membrane protein insertion efficiency factor YidD [Vibrio porteresiae DSM 19223]